MDGGMNRNRDGGSEGQTERGTNVGRAGLKDAWGSKGGGQRRNGWKKQWMKRGWKERGMDRVSHRLTEPRMEKR